MLPYQRIAILFAVPQEMAPLSRRLLPAERSSSPGRIPGRTGRIGTREVLVTVSGVGMRNARRGADLVIRSWQPDLLVMAGVAGALSPDLAIGDVVAADRIVTADAAETPDVAPPSGSAAIGPVRSGALLSVDRVLVTPEQKGEARRSASPPLPLAVEMETAGVITAARASSVPWAAVRAVSDTAGEALPLDFNRLRDASGGLPVGRIALAALTHPTAIPGLIRLGGNTSLAAKALASYLHAWLTADSGTPSPGAVRMLSEADAIETARAYLVGVGGRLEGPLTTVLVTDPKTGRKVWRVKGNGACRMWTTVTVDAESGEVIDTWSPPGKG